MGYLTSGGLKHGVRHDATAQAAGVHAVALVEVRRVPGGVEGRAEIHPPRVGEMASVSLRTTGRIPPRPQGARSYAHRLPLGRDGAWGYGMPTNRPAPAATHWWTMALTRAVGQLPVSIMSLSPPPNRTISGFWGRGPGSGAGPGRPVEVSPTAGVDPQMGRLPVQQVHPAFSGARLYPWSGCRPGIRSSWLPPLLYGNLADARVSLKNAGPPHR